MLRSSHAARTLWGAALAAVLCVATEARAERRIPTRPFGRNDPFLPLRLDGHAALDWDGRLGVGARADFVLISGTFRYSARDELALSVGGDVTFINFDGSNAIDGYPTVALQWALGVNDRFNFYTELGLVGRIERSGWSGINPAFGFGARYYLRRSFGLQGRFGWPIAFAGGVVF